MKRCSLCLTCIMSQLISGLLSCTSQSWEVRDTAFISTPHYGHGTCILGRSWCVPPSPVLLRPNTSCDIPNMISTVWQAIVFYLVTLTTGMIFRNSRMRKFRAPSSHSKSQDPRSLCSIQNTPKLGLTACPIPAWTTVLSSTINESQCLTTLLIDTLNTMGDTNPS